MADNMAAMAPEKQHGQHDASFEKGRERARVASPWPTTGNAKVTPTERDNAEQMQRAASYTYLPSAKDQTLGNLSVVEVKGDGSIAHSHNVHADFSSPDASPPDTSGWNTPEENGLAIRSPPKARDIIAHLQKGSNDSFKQQDSERSSLCTLDSSTQQSGASFGSGRTASTVSSTPASSTRPSIVKKSFSKSFSGRWYSSTSAISTPSRSPSPKKQEIVLAGTNAEEPADGDDGPQLQDVSRRRSIISRRRSLKPEKETKVKPERQGSKSSLDEVGLQKPAAAIIRKGTFLRKKATHASGLAKVNGSDGTKNTSSPSTAPVPDVPTLPKSFSSDRLPMPRSQSTQSDRGVPIPSRTNEKQHMSPLSSTKKKDELWSQFRTIDADFSKFQSKSTALKANVVRSSLMPFLRQYATHASNTTLRPEDIDRRTGILNKWWTGLIELLHGKNNQSMSGTDRPIILDAISGIMERVEWRLSPSPFCPIHERVNLSLAHSNRSNTSLGFSTTDFLAESVRHNVRNIFIQNLTAQMVFVVDKMSLRHASASLVTFCGKACAYAFLFVPGMADVLVRLWELPMDIMRRVLQENGIGKFDIIPDHVCTNIVSNFPPALHSLGFQSLRRYMRRMRAPPPLPIGTLHVLWWGQWLDRWRGRESDLFYAFVKQHHILATDFLPPDATAEEIMCSPGMLLVQSQVLANLDSTIHRDTSQKQRDESNAPATPTFDDLLGDPDLVASALPLPPTNAVRLMAENRLIMLVRDFLSERSEEHPIARELFAQSFNKLLQAAACGTSMFDHSACYTLLDFMEEAVIILTRYEALKPRERPLLNAKFWQVVCRKMMESENTMTEIRLYAFLYTVWNMVVSTSDLKTTLCMDLLLDPDVFDSRFNHWCPMVRAYFMRLLCWRIGRYDGEEGRTDLSMLVTLQARLQQTWSHHLYMREEAERGNRLYSESYPCHPAPGRRLLIMRTDNVISPSGSYLTFDGLVQDSPTQMAKHSTSVSSSVFEPESRPESESSNPNSDTESNNKSVGGFLRKMISSGTGGPKSRSKSRGPDKRSETPIPTPRVAGAPDLSGVTRTATEDMYSPPVQTPAPSPYNPPSFRSLSFKFSLEFLPSNKPMHPLRLFPPRLPLPAQKLLEQESKAISAQAAMKSQAPRGDSVARARYASRALAEWTVVVGECQSFFERRLKEGVPSKKWVETPMLGVEVFKRPS